MKIKMKSSKKLTGLFCLILAMFLISTTLLPIYTCDSFQTNNEVGETTYELVYKTEDDSFLEHSSYQVIEEYESFYLIKSSQIDYHTTNEYQLPTLNTNLNEVRLQRETIDTSSRPQTHSSYEDYDGLYLVQSIGPIKSEWRDELASTGDIHGYFPENTYLMDLSADKLEGMEEKDFVQWVGEFKTEYRVCPELDEIEGKENLNIVVYEELEKIIPELDAFGDIYDYGGQRVRMEADMDHVDLIAEVEGVQWIEVHREVELMNHDAQWTVQSGEPEIRSIWDQGITGEGQMVGVADTGIDYTHAQFRDPDDNPIGPDHRKIETYVEFAGDFDGHGHGTHVSGTIAGNDEIVGDSQPYEGVAKNARLSKYDIGTDSGGLQLPSPISDIFEVAYEDGARIHSNSWGSLDSYYTSDAAVVDEFMWDNKDMLILYAAGNSGDGENTIASPATAKNVLSVGASGVGDREVSQNDMASFSSRGPTDDGRLKPEVVAPGQGSVGYYEGLDIVSAESDGDPDTYHNSYTDKRGTSMSCPAVAGAATLVREYFEDGHYPGGGIENPSAALVKSVLVNSAEEITGEGTYANSNEFPNNDQGFGRVTLDNALEFEGDQRNLKVHDDIIGLFTGESDTHTLHVEDSSEPLEVSLAYTDYPGTPGASNVLVNDLNLRVESPTGEEYKGNVFEGTNPGQSSTGGEYDDLNPTQNVLRLEPEPGEWEVEVIAGNVPEGPQPYALAMTGSFNEIDQGPLSVDFDHEPLLPKEGETVQFHDTSSSSEGEIIDWYWDFDDGTTSTEQNPNHSFEEKGIYDVNLTVIDNNGETGSVVSQIMIKEPEYCEVEGGNTNYEYITNVKFNGIDRDSGDDGGYADHTDSVSDPVEPGETYELSVTMNTGGFTNYATAVIDWSQDYLLGNEEVIKIGYGSDDPLTVSTEITVPEDVENGKTRMRVMNKYNDYHLDPCEDQNYGETEDYTVKIGGEETPPEGPEADFDYEPDVPYQNEIIQFKDSSSEGDGDIVGWNWDFGDGTTSAEHEPTHAYEDEGLYTVELEVVDENGLADTVSKEIIIESELKGPEADLSFTPEEPEEDEEVKFTDESIEGDGSIVEWTWDFGDGETSTEQEPTYVYDEEGTYTVELRIVDENDLDDEISKEIDVKQLEPPEADFVFSPEQPKEGEALQFTDESIEGDGSIVEWTWDFGDGITSEKQSPTYYYSEAGTYLVELNVTDDNDLFDSTTRSIEVQEKEESGEYCEVEGGDTSWGEYITNVEFNGIDKTSGDDGGYADHTDYVSDPVVPGESYELSVTVSTGGFSSYVSVVIDWSQNHELSDEEVIEVGHGNSDPLTVKTMVTVPEDAEEGKTRMRVMQEFNRYHDEPCEDQNYGETEDYTVKIGGEETPPEGPEADFDYEPDVPYQNEIIQFKDSSSEGDGSIVEWTWDFGDGETSTEQEPTYVYDEEGTYTVELRVVDENELDDEISKEIDVKQLEPPEADFAFSPEQPKEGEALQFTDESTEGDGSIVEWTWDFGDGITSEKQSPTHYYSEAGTYLVELNVTDDNDLFGSTTRSIEVQEKEESGEYCEVEGGDTSWGEYITNVEFNGIDKTSGDDGGYADHTDHVSDPVVPGESYELSVTVSTGGFSSYVSVVIDWSQNHELSDEEVIEVGHGNSDPLTVKTMVTVPEDAEEGKTRMRVMQEFNRYHDEPCEDQNYGETEDYTVKIGDGDLDYSGLDHRQEPEENRDEEMKIEKLHIFDRYKLITYVVASALLSTIFLKSEKLKIPYLK